MYKFSAKLFYLEILLELVLYGIKDYINYKQNRLTRTTVGLYKYRMQRNNELNYKTFIYSDVNKRSKNALLEYIREDISA